ncbi:hypothetical protein CDCA_CDCA05G1670 [Cyanidium caldarium]|uniref:mRNA cap guanine-N(7) methyltransferase n=1 Tax=Cyanidium caldarium TaxID=2771 RepID=A0AAV9IU61_CYACA|nr:hypothetical protein CDCA_CDCA05G1670 [Cyanidium caldarium]
MDQAQVAEHYNTRRDEGRQGRRQSRILQLRNLNNWVKSVLISLHLRPGYAVLDLACGKGGDLQKFVRGHVSLWVGVDHARVSLQHALQRYNELPDEQRVFPAFLICADAFGVPLEPHWDRAWPKFDLVSCQFAMHYAFESAERVRMLLRNVTARLKPGGFFIGTTPDANVLVRKLRAAPGWWFGNSVYRIEFEPPPSSETTPLKAGGDDQADTTAPAAAKTFPADRPYGIRYRFTLDENVEDCPEYLVHFPSLEVLAREEFGLELLLQMNFHEFFHTFALAKDAPPTYRELLRVMRVFHPESHSLSSEEWDAAYLYTVFAFRKVAANGDGGACPSWPGLVDEKDWPCRPCARLDPEQAIVDVGKD